ncbi:MAG: hypothetical protein KF743_07260 [Fimbriimonadaceae bacterium]|nr:hypothetical protein [Fimbriimonadaceae bacterium]
MTRTKAYLGVTGSTVQNPPYWHADVASLVTPLTTTQNVSRNDYLNEGEYFSPEWWYFFTEVTQNGMWNEATISRFGFDYSQVEFRVVKRTIPSGL